MKIRRNRITFIMAFILAAAVSLVGCSRDGEAVIDPQNGTDGQDRNQAVGRYVESEIALPEGLTYGSVIAFLNGPEGENVLFTRKEKDGLSVFSAYCLSEDLTWEEKDCTWLNQLGIAYGYENLHISYGEDRKLYAVYAEGNGQDLIPRHHIFVSEDGADCAEIEMPVLLETNETGYVYAPSGFTALENGNLLFEAGSSLFLFKPDGQKKIAEIMTDHNHYIPDGNRFYVMDEESRSLILYDGESGAEKSRSPLELEGFYEAAAIAGDNGDLSLVSKDGIQILKKDAAIWEQIVEGKRNTMGSPKYYTKGFAKGGQGDYFVLYDSMDETYKLARYSFDPDMPVEPETELTVFALYENATIRQAVSAFQIENPNVKVEYRPLMGENSAAVAEDYIKVLNTELLAGKGPDIVILDGLSEASYVEKGVLEDLTEVIESLAASGDFLENVADACRTDGKIYAVPVRIGLPLTFGRKGVLEEAGRLDTLAGLAQSYERGQIFGTLNPEAFLSVYADAWLHDMIKEDGTVQRQALQDFLVHMKQIFDGSNLSDGTQENRPSSVWNLLEDGTFLYTEEVAGLNLFGAGASVVEQAQGELEADVIALNSTFIPYGTVGINKNSEKKETALAFLKTVLSDEVQRSDFYDGFSVNRNVLEYLCGIERTSADAYGGAIDGIDGRTYEFKLGWPSEPLRRKAVEFCKSAAHSSGRYWRVKQVLLEDTKGYFEQTQSLEEVMESLMTKISVYLRE